MISQSIIIELSKMSPNKGFLVAYVQKALLYTRLDYSPPS